MADPVVTLAGLQLHPPAIDGTGYLIDDGTGGGVQGGFTGWYGAPAPRTEYTAQPAQAGSFWSPFAFAEERAIAISGTLVMPTSAALLAAQRALAAICPRPDTLYPLVVADDAGTLTAQVQRSAAVLINPISQLACAWSISVTAPDPRRYDMANPSSGSTSLPSSMSGLNWTGGGAGGLDWTGGGAGGLSWGSMTSSGTVTLTNPGLADSWPVLVLSGTLTNPVITNQTTGQVLAYTGTLGPSDQLVITTSARSVLLNGSADRRPLLTPAQWASVDAASSATFSLSSSSGADTGALAATLYPAWW